MRLICTLFHWIIFFYIAFFCKGLEIFLKLRMLTILDRKDSETFALVKLFQHGAFYVFTGNYWFSIIKIKIHHEKFKLLAKYCCEKNLSSNYYVIIKNQYCKSLLSNVLVKAMLLQDLSTWWLSNYRTLRSIFVAVVFLSFKM